MQSTLGTPSSRVSRLTRLFAPARSTWRSTWRFALDLGLPPLCPACRGLLGHEGGLWASRRRRLSFIAPPSAQRLGTPFGYDPRPGVEIHPYDGPHSPHPRARAAVRYDDVA